MALNGAEPVRAEVLKRFAETFKPCGFDLSAFCPGYGMAEATLKVAAVRQQDLPVFYKVEADALEQNRVVEAKSHQQNVQTLVGCGRSEIDTKIIIVHPESLTQCTSDEVGKFGYQVPALPRPTGGNPRRPSKLFRLTWQTVVLMLAQQDEVRNRFCVQVTWDSSRMASYLLRDASKMRSSSRSQPLSQDIELTVEKSHPALRTGCGAAFSVEIKGEERLVVFRR
jgi:acyl-CoA synthetase (AMP-forming)/AMP-acid ligase II